MKINKIKIGQELGGGFYIGEISDDGIKYHLIVAPKEEGEAIKKWMECTTGAESNTNGPANTAKILQAVTTFPAAQFCTDLRIGGFTDWYLPAKYELILLMDAEKTIAKIGQGLTGSYYYWSASEYSATGALLQYWDSGYPGDQNGSTKSNAYCVRAVRRLAI